MQTNPLLPLGPHQVLLPGGQFIVCALVPLTATDHQHLDGRNPATQPAQGDSVPSLAIFLEEQRGDESCFSFLSDFLLSVNVP